MNISGKVPGGVFQPQTLEVDEKIFDKSLRIIDSIGGELPNDALPLFRQEERKSLLPEQELPAINVVPDPGMCVKTKNIAGEKFFINFCKVHAIPPAKPISEEALQDIIADEDYNTDFRIPMSLGSPRKEKDKSGKECMACDVAVNSVWYDQTMIDSLTFTTFLVTVAMEGLCNKYGDVCNLDRQNWSILRNKRYMGKIQRHTIQQRASVTKIQEVDSKEDKEVLMKPLATTKQLVTPMKEKPKTVLIKKPIDASYPEAIVATVDLPKVISANDLAVDLGQDRFVVNSENYSLDIFLPFNVDPDQSKAEFHRDNRVLTMTMKVLEATKTI